MRIVLLLGFSCNIYKEREKIGGQQRDESLKSYHIPDITAVIQRGKETGLDIRPAALVLVLLLCPDQLGIPVQIRLLLDQIEGERRDLKSTIKIIIIGCLYLKQKFLF